MAEVYGEVVATGVSIEDYMTHYAAQHCEYIEGQVIQLSSATWHHNAIITYLLLLLEAYFEQRPIGCAGGQTVVMRLPAFPDRRREPDVLVVLDDNAHTLEATYTHGPADIVVEVVSEESTARDYSEKLKEYETGGVPEYWVIDPIRRNIDV